MEWKSETHRWVNKDTGETHEPDSQNFQHPAGDKRLNGGTLGEPMPGTRIVQPQPEFMSASFSTAAHEFQDALPGDVKADLYSYTRGDGYKKANAQLRAGTDPAKLTGTTADAGMHPDGTPRAPVSIADLNAGWTKAFDASPDWKPPVTVFRGLKLSDTDSAALVAAVQECQAAGGSKLLRFKGWQSTSLDPAISGGPSFSGKTPMFEIACHKGPYLGHTKESAGGLGNFPHEAEILLPHNQAYRVVGTTTRTFKLDNGQEVTRNVIRLEQVVGTHAQDLKERPLRKGVFGVGGQKGITVTGMAANDPDAARFTQDTLDGVSVAEPADAESVKLAAESVAETPVARSGNGRPASDETALAGKDGAKLAALITDAKDDGARTLAELVREAVKGYRGKGPLLDKPQVEKLADVIAGVNTTANLLGRSRVREMAERVERYGQGISKFAALDVPLERFADAAPVIRTPEEAATYFNGLVPNLGIDPLRLAGEQRRLAFTLAASANQTLTQRVQSVIGAGIRGNESTADVTARIVQALDSFGATHRNPQYAEMVFRTNAADAFQTGMYEEARTPDLAHVFPVWEYLGIRDGRQGKDHEPKFDRYYPAKATFAEVRGNRPFNCRCSLRWVDGYDWADLLKAGTQLESDW